jgi:hypothetical protein
VAHVGFALPWKPKRRRRFILTTNGPPRVQFNLPATYTGMVRRGTQVVVHAGSDRHEGNAIDGEVTRVAPMVEPFIAHSAGDGPVVRWKVRIAAGDVCERGNDPGCRCNSPRPRHTGVEGCLDPTVLAAADAHRMAIFSFKSAAFNATEISLRV